MMEDQGTTATQIHLIFFKSDFTFLKKNKAGY